MYNTHNPGGERCLILLDTNICYPGQAIAGRVECNFPTEEKVKAIRVRFRGRGKVKFHEGRDNYLGNQNYLANETYFEMESNLLTDETTFPPGKYSYPFTFNLPNDVPPTFTETEGNIKHSVVATIDRPWAIDYQSKLLLAVHSLIDLNKVDHVKNPVELSETKTPFAVFGETGPIMLTVRLPVTGYAPNQMVAFTAQVKNMSKINIQEVRFQLVQGFTFYTRMRHRIVNKVKGQEFVIIDGFVRPGSERSWNLKLQVPHDVFIENLYFCNIIKSFMELRGELALPFPHNKLKIVIPLILGSIPLQTPVREH